ncbi:MAG: hypothetical protein QOH71_4400 [Blastocatellia bacterium]|nr:hypothetical protein [Blastocatellia bacterium]
MWENIASGQQVKLGVIQVDIAGSSRIEGPAESVKLLKDILRQESTAIVQRRGGRAFPWAGDGGAFMFRVASSEQVSAMVLCAMQILANMPVVNDEIATRTGVSIPIKIRVSCDSLEVVYDPDPTGMHGSALNRFFKSEREISLVDNLVISERVYDELPDPLRARFQFHKESTELRARLYRLASTIEPTQPAAHESSPPVSKADVRANIEKLARFIQSEASLSGKVEIVRLTSHVPVLESQGSVTVPSEKRQAALARLLQPYSNDAHAVLAKEPNWNDEPVVLKFGVTDYVGICALSGPEKLPVSIISVSVVVLCAELREIYLHRRDESSRTNPNDLHTYGGAYMPPGISKLDDALDLITTAQREVFEELNLTFWRSPDIPMMLTKELDTGFIQLVLLGVSVSPQDVAGSRHNWEGKKVVISFDELPERLTSTKEQWVPTGKTHLLAWLALGAPNAGQSPRFGTYSATELFDAVISG